MELTSLAGEAALVSPHSGLMKAMMGLSDSYAGRSHPPSHFPTPHSGPHVKLKYLSKLNRHQRTRSAPKSAGCRNIKTNNRRSASARLNTSGSTTPCPGASSSDSTTHDKQHSTKNKNEDNSVYYHNKLQEPSLPEHLLVLSSTAEALALAAFPKRNSPRSPGAPLFLDDFFHPSSASPSSRPIRIPSRLSKEEQKEARKLRGERLRYRLRPRHVPLAIARAGEATYEFEGGAVPPAHLPSPPADLLDFETADDPALQDSLPRPSSANLYSPNLWDDSLDSPSCEESEGSSGHTCDEEHEEEDEDSYSEEIFQLDELQDL